MDDVSEGLRLLTDQYRDRLDRDLPGAVLDLGGLVTAAASQNYSAIVAKLPNILTTLGQVLTSAASLSALAKVDELKAHQDQLDD